MYLYLVRAFLFRHILKCFYSHIPLDVIPYRDDSRGNVYDLNLTTFFFIIMYLGAGTFRPYVWIVSTVHFL